MLDLMQIEKNWRRIIISSKKQEKVKKQRNHLLIFSSLKCRISTPFDFPMIPNLVFIHYIFVIVKINSKLSIAYLIIDSKSYIKSLACSGVEVS